MAGTPKGRRRRRETPWYRHPPTLVPVIGAAIAAAIGLFQLIDRFVVDEPPAASAEYIVDVSRGMRGKIGRKPKLPAVRAEILAHVKNTPSLSTALRLAGPSCSDSYLKPDVPFDEANGDEFEAALQRVQAGGKSDFANSVRHAASDLIGKDAPAASRSKTIYMFLGGPDTCSSRPVAVIRRALKDLRPSKDVELSLKFVGVKVPREAREVLRATRREAEDLGYRAEVELADRPSELEDVLPEDPEPDPSENEYGSEPP